MAKIEEDDALEGFSQVAIKLHQRTRFKTHLCLLEFSGPFSYALGLRIDTVHKYVLRFRN